MAKSLVKTSAGKFWFKAGDTPKFCIYTFPPQYTTYSIQKNGTFVNIQMPSGDNILVCWYDSDYAASNSGGFLAFSADFPIAVVYQGIHWGSYECYGNQDPVYIYKLPVDYDNLQWWQAYVSAGMQGDFAEEAGAAIIANLDPMGAVMRDNKGTLTVMTPQYAAGNYGGSY